MQKKFKCDVPRSLEPYFRIVELFVFCSFAFREQFRVWLKGTFVHLANSARPLSSLFCSKQRVAAEYSYRITPPWDFKQGGGRPLRLLLPVPRLRKRKVFKRDKEIVGVSQSNF